MDDRRPPEVQSMREKVSDITLLLRATRPKGYDDYYNTRSPLLGKEISLGVLDKEDMLANDLMVWCILEYFVEGQVDLAWDLMTWYQNDIKTTPSIDGRLLDKITSQEIKYSTTQTMHEYQHPTPRKKPLIGGNRPPTGG